MSIKRITTLLMKDLKENYIVVLIVLLIPIIAFILPQIKLPTNEVIGIVVSRNESNENKLLDSGFKVKEFKTNKEAEQLLMGEKIDAYINFEEKIVYTYSEDMDFLGRLRSSLSSPSNQNFDEIKLNIENANISKISYHALLCVILFSMLCLIACPIVYFSEKTYGIDTYFFTTPVTNLELILAKMLFCFIAFTCSLFLFLYIICGYRVDLVKLFIIVLALTFFASLLSGIVTLLFNSIDVYIMIMTPVAMVLILGIVLMYQTKILNKMVIYPIIYKLILSNTLLIQNALIIFMTCIILLAIYLLMIHNYRRKELHI